MLLRFALWYSLAAAMWPSAWITGESCGKLARTMYNCSELDSQCFCGDVKYLRTVAQCIVVHTNKNTTSEGEAWDHFIKSYCELNNAVPIDDDLYEVLEYPNNGTAHVGEFDFIRGYRAMYDHLQQKDTSAIQGGVLTLYWLVLPLLAGLLRLWNWISLHYGPSTLKGNRASSAVFLQKHIGLPALRIGNRRHMAKFQYWKFSFSVGTRWETLIVCVYLLLSFIFCLCPYTFMDYNPFYETRWMQMMRYGSDRTGIMATIQFPLLVLFATRNNILIWISGWSYATFNRYHRAISRVTYALLIVHSVLKHLFAKSYGASLVLYFYPVPYYRYGVAAMFLFAIMIFSAQLRHAFYEVFLSLHLLCAFFGMVMSILHLRGIGYQHPLYICFGLWGLDIIIRLGRISFFNFAILFRPIIGHRKISYGTMRVFQQEVTHINVKLPVKWHYSPGQYVYVHLSWWSFLTGGHPFSVVMGAEDDSTVNVVFKVRCGFTKKFRNALVQYGCTDDMKVTLPVYIEGPYGVAQPVEHYGEALIVAGGIGITGVLGYVSKMARQKHCQRIMVVWCVPKRDDFKPFSKHIMQLLKFPNTEFALYCRGLRKEAINESLASVLTSLPIQKETDDFSKSNDTLQFYDMMVKGGLLKRGEFPLTANGDSSPSDDLSIDTRASYPAILSGRPNIPDIVSTFFEQSQSSVAVVSCGPAAMVDQVRECTSRYLHHATHGRVDLFEEAFEW